MTKLHYTRRKNIYYSKKQVKTWMDNNKLMISFTKLIQYFELYVKRQILQHKKFTICQLSLKSSVILISLCFGFSVNFL